MFMASIYMKMGMLAESWKDLPGLVQAPLLNLEETRVPACPSPGHPGGAPSPDVESWSPQQAAVTRLSGVLSCHHCPLGGLNQTWSMLHC